MSSRPQQGRSQYQQQAPPRVGTTSSSGSVPEPSPSPPSGSRAAGSPVRPHGRRSITDQRSSRDQDKSREEPAPTKQGARGAPERPSTSSSSQQAAASQASAYQAAAGPRAQSSSGAIRTPASMPKPTTPGAQSVMGDPGVQVFAAGTATLSLREKVLSLTKLNRALEDKVLLLTSEAEERIRSSAAASTSAPSAVPPVAPAAAVAAAAAAQALQQRLEELETALLKSQAKNSALAVQAAAMAGELQQSALQRLQSGSVEMMGPSTPSDDGSQLLADAQPCQPAAARGALQLLAPLAALRAAGSAGACADGLGDGSPVKGAAPSPPMSPLAPRTPPPAAQPASGGVPPVPLPPRQDSPGPPRPSRRACAEMGVQVSLPDAAGATALSWDSSSGAAAAAAAAAAVATAAADAAAAAAASSTQAARKFQVQLGQANSAIEFLRKEHAEVEALQKDTEAQRREFAARYAFCVLDDDNDGYILSSQIQVFDLFQPYSPETVELALKQWKYASGFKGYFTMEDFLRFVTLADERGTRESQRFWFNVIDMDGDGCLSCEDAKYFYDAVPKGDGFVVSFEDLWFQLIDMIKPVNPRRGFTSADLWRCKLGAGALGLLLNHNNMLLQRSTAEWGRGDYPL